VGGKGVVSGKSITFTPDRPLDTAAEYTFTLKKVTSATGGTLSDVTIRFTPRYTDYNELPDDAKKRLNVDPEDQDEAYYAGVIAIAGSTLITERGVTQDQMSLLKIAFYNHFKANNQEVRALDFGWRWR